jgi:hypothetical protein
MHKGGGFVNRPNRDLGFVRYWNIPFAYIFRFDQRNLLDCVYLGLLFHFQLSRQVIFLNLNYSG